MNNELAKRIAIIITALAAFIGSVTPGFLAFMDDEPHQLAAKSEQKADLSYELIRDQLSAIQMRLTVLEKRENQNMDMLLEIFKEQAKKEEKVAKDAARRRPGRKPASTKKTPVKKAIEAIEVQKQEADNMPRKIVQLPSNLEDALEKNGKKL